ncbi:MAG: protein translocase subunit SecF [Elusimicrobiota bacterium]
MEFFKKVPNIDFVGMRYVFFGFSGVLIVLTILTMLFRGLNLGIDFSGGNLIQLGFSQQINLGEIRNIVGEAGYKNAQIQDVSTKQSVIIRLRAQQGAGTEVAKNLVDFIQQKVPGNVVIIERNEFVGGAVGKYLVEKTFYAILFSLLAIVLYVAIRFKSSTWGIAGIVSLAHDVFVVFGIVLMLGRETSLLTVTALLTLAGYSINDTIVVLDRIRENLRLKSNLQLKDMINVSMNETLSRTIITGISVIMVLVVLVLIGGEVLYDFSLTMLIGVLFGTYSSVAIAMPIAYEWEQWRRRGLASNKNKK